MPYISTEQVKEIRQALKKEFPNVKFSVTKEHCTSLHVSIMESDIDFTTYNPRTKQLETTEQINHYWLEDNFAYNKPALDFLTAVLALIDKIHPQKTMFVDSDYSSVPNYYLNIRVGKWDKPYILKAA